MHDATPCTTHDATPCTMHDATRCASQVGPDLPPQPVTVKKEATNVPEVVYTYDVKWEYSEIKRAPMSGGGQRPAPCS